MDRRDLIALCSRAWALASLAHVVGAGTQARVSPVAHALGASRNAVSDSFSCLEQLGLIERTPGHGHPLRPEFRLTRAGRTVGQWANRLLACVSQDAGARLLRKTWTLPILHELGKPATFSRLRWSLHPITDRSLSLALKELTSAGWIERQVRLQDTPPGVEYAAAGTGQQLAIVLQDLKNL